MLTTAKHARGPRFESGRVPETFSLKFLSHYFKFYSPLNIAIFDKKGKKRTRNPEGTSYSVLNIYKFANFFYHLSIGRRGGDRSMRARQAEGPGFAPARRIRHFYFFVAIFFRLSFKSSIQVFFSGFSSKLNHFLLGLCYVSVRSR